MASIAKRPDGRWRARYRDAAGHEHAKHFDRKVDAERWLTLQTSSILRGEWVDPELGKITFKDYAEEWRKAQAQHRASTAAHHETMLRRHVYPTFGDRSLVSIKPADVRAWTAKTSIRLAPTTVKVLHGIVASIFLAAVDDRRIASSPCQRRSRAGRGYLPEVQPRQVEPIRPTDLQMIIAKVDARFRALVVLAAGTGLRQSEALGLTRDRVDFLRRTVRVDRQLVYPPGDAWEWGPPKTRASNRLVPLPQVVADALAAHVDEYSVGDHGLLFTDFEGLPIRRSWFSAKVWRPAVLASKVANQPTFHDLRHFYASLLIRHGESVKVVQARLGHATAAETLDTYSHLWPDSDDRTRTAIDEVLGAGGSATSVLRVAD